MQKIFEWGNGRKIKKIYKKRICKDWHLGSGNEAEEKNEWILLRRKQVALAVQHVCLLVDIKQFL